MDPHLINMTILDRVDADVNEVIRASVAAGEGKTRLCVLGTKGSYRYLQGEQVAKLATTEKYLLAAQQGLLYVERTTQMAFAAALDNDSGLPVLLENYDDAFRKRSYAGTASPANVKGAEPEQGKLM